MKCVPIQPVKGQEGRLSCVRDPPFVSKLQIYIMDGSQWSEFGVLTNTTCLHTRGTIFNSDDDFDNFNGIILYIFHPLHKIYDFDLCKVSSQGAPLISVDQLVLYTRTDLTYF